MSNSRFVEQYALLHREHHETFFCTFAQQQPHSAEIHITEAQEVDTSRFPELTLPLELETELMSLVGSGSARRENVVKEQIAAMLLSFLQSQPLENAQLRNALQNISQVATRCTTTISDSHYAGINFEEMSEHEPSVIHFKTHPAIVRNLSRFGTEGGAQQAYLFLSTHVPHIPIHYCLGNIPFLPRHIYISLYDQAKLDQYVGAGQLRHSRRNGYLYSITDSAAMKDSWIGTVVLVNPSVSPLKEAAQIYEWNQLFLATQVPAFHQQVLGDLIVSNQVV